MKIKNNEKKSKKNKAFVEAELYAQLLPGV